MGRIGGTLFIAANGVQIPVRGNWEVGMGRLKKQKRVGADGVHGHTVMPQVPFVRGEATAQPDLDLLGILDIEDATVTAELANGKTPVLRGAVQTAEGVLNTEEGQVQLEFQGDTLEYT